MEKRLVIIPTYNEKDNIEAIIRAVMELPHNFEVLIVDDSSPDGTIDLVKNLIPKFENRLFIEIRKEKEGLGKAYIHGFIWALKNNYDYIFEMDADFSHNPHDLPKLYKALKEENVDFSIGSRYIKGVSVINWSIYRILLSYFASVYTRFITGMPIMDTTAGFIGYKKKVLENIKFDNIQMNGYGFQVEMKYKAWKKGFKHKEVPIIFKERELGESKLDNSIIWEASWGIFRMRLLGLLSSNKK